MGRFDKYVDAPNGIKNEGQEVELFFQRLSDTTGRISWNIPAPANGCDAFNQSYNGIVITVSSQPANYLSTSPVDGTYYTGDPSVDPDLNVGSKLDGAMVVGAFYNDKVTTMLDVTDLKPNTSYYFSGYAVDNVARYHREGVHAYSLPTGPQEPNKEKDLPAIQDVMIETDVGIQPTTLTGLDQMKDYLITLLIDGRKYQLNIPGTLALDYDDLVYTINHELIRLTDDKYVGANPAHAGSFYVDLPHERVYAWDGYTETLTPALFDENDPSTPVDGSYWFDGTTLWIYGNGQWNQNTLYTAEFNITDPPCGSYWFDGAHVYKWEKVLWCQLPTYLTDTNPLTPPNLDCASFWYNTDTYLVYQWNVQVRSWDIVNPIYSDFDPNNIPSGSYWYSQTDANVYYYAGSQWNPLDVIKAEADVNGNFVGDTYPNIYWFVPSTQKLYRRDAQDTVWVELDVILYITDPRDRAACQLWWDWDNDVMNLWDTVNSQWVAVSMFFQQSNDPSLSPNIPLNSAWMGPNGLTIINNPDCTSADYVYSANDPMNPNLGDVRYQPSVDTFWVWNGSGWQVIDVLHDPNDPYSLSIGSLWYNTASGELLQWDSANFNVVSSSLTPFVPTIGDLWYEPLSEILYGWNGTTWVKTIGIAAAKLILRSNFKCDTCKSPIYRFNNYDDGLPLTTPHDTIRFYTKALGCAENIQLCFDDGQTFVFANIAQNLMYGQPIPGYSALESGPSYQQLGVGTDGSPDERRALDAVVRGMLGDPVTKAELTKEQIDICISNALKMLRKNSDLGYKRAFFFMDVYPKQQTYLMKDKCVGFNKIVNVTSIYRTRLGLFGSGALGGDGLFAYSMLQNLYQVGTFDMLSYHLVSSYTKELQNLFADFIMFQFVESTRALKLYQTFYMHERLLLDAIIERTEQDLLTNRETSMWIQRWTVAEAKLMLAQSRGKFQQLAGPNGSLTLNAQDLIGQAQQEMESLETELHDFVMQDIVDTGMRSHFIVG
jgi:hypothetical protein